MMAHEGSFGDGVPKSVLNQTDISTGIGPTGTDTPAPKDLMPHSEEQEQLHSLKEPLSRPKGALFEVGSGAKSDKGDTSPCTITEEEQNEKNSSFLSKMKDKFAATH